MCLESDPNLEGMSFLISPKILQRTGNIIWSVLKQCVTLNGADTVSVVGETVGQTLVESPEAK